MKRAHLTIAFLLAISKYAAAQPPDATLDLSGVIEYATPPEMIADSIAVFTPDRDMPLHKPDKTERTIHGRINKLEKGIQPNVIVHTAHTIIFPLRANTPVRMFLKRFQNRDAYYPIAIFPLYQEMTND